MSSLALSRELAVSFPRLLLAAVQPYQTIAGPALSTNFMNHSSLLPFQRLPFTHCSVAPVYFHTLLHSLAEYCETPRPVKTSHVKQLHAPYEHFWDDIGTVNCFYSTTYSPLHREHPAMGAVELVQASHRKESDLRLTLYDDRYQPLVAMVMTGPRGEKTPPVLPIRVHHSGPLPASGDAPDGPRCRMLPHMTPPSDRTGYWSSPNNQWCGIEEVLPGELGNYSTFGGLYGPLEALRNGGYAQRACYGVVTTHRPSPEGVSYSADPPVGRTSSEASTDPPMPEARIDLADTGASAAGHDRLKPGQKEEQPQSLHAPPWMLMLTIRELCERLHQEGCLSPTSGGPPLRMGENAPWCMAAYQAVQCADVLFDEPFDLVCAAPRVVLNYRVAPWRHEIGQPAANGFGACVVALRVEVRQLGAPTFTGTFYFQHDSSH